MNRRLSWWLSLLTLAVLATTSLAWSAMSPVEQVTVLMPAPFAGSTASLVQQFNRDHLGRIHLDVTSGPRDTEAMSDLAISSLLLGDPPYRNTPLLVGLNHSIPFSARTTNQP